MRALAALVLVVALAGCAPDAGAGTQRIEVAGRITEVASSGSGRSYVIEVAELGLLPLDVDGRPPLQASGVTVQVPDSVDIPDGQDGRFAALAAYAEGTDEGLTVVGFLD